MAGERAISLEVNGRRHDLWLRASASLLDVLHDDLGFGEVRYGCGEGVCGTCTILLDGEPVSACLMLAVQAEGHAVTTVAGLAAQGQEMHRLQECFLKAGALQCGFCTPGMILTSYALCERMGRPSREQVRYELIGNLCRCTGYAKIFEAIDEYSGASGSGPAEQPA
ncbi:MAG: (2Fe-2S)-binding protein [Acidimicrobiales bacterium]